MRVVCISDTHGRHRKLKLPDGDMLLCAGDITSHGTLNNAIDFMEWFAAQPHRFKVFTVGNHDWVFEKAPERIVVPNGIHYLNDSGIELAGHRIWASAIQPRFLNWAFNRDRGAAIRKHWDLIPKDTTILITHGPAQGHLDDLMPGFDQRRSPEEANGVGCADLRDCIDGALHSLRLHVFGHLHYQGCQTKVKDGVTYVNAAVVDDGYSLRGQIQVVDL